YCVVYARTSYALLQRDSEHGCLNLRLLQLGPPRPRDLHSFPTRRSSDLVPSALRAVTGLPAGLPHSESNGSPAASASPSRFVARSEEHTSELQSRFDLVCRLLLEKKEKTSNPMLRLLES